MNGGNAKPRIPCDASSGPAASFGCSHGMRAAVCLCEECAWNRIAADLQRRERQPNDDSWMHPWGCSHP